MTSTEEYYPTLEDLTANGVTLEEGVELVERSHSLESDYEGLDVGVEGPAPILIIKTRDGVFKAFFMMPVANNMSKNLYDVHEGKGESAEAARLAAIEAIIAHIRAQAAEIEDYIDYRSATDELAELINEEEKKGEKK